MTDQALRALLRTAGLGRVVDQIVALAAPCVRVYAQPAPEVAIPIGASKLGGQPDLPAGVPWLSWHESMAFLAQFNLAEVAPYDPTGVLPTQGLLSFFYETDGEPLYAERWGLPEDAPYLDDYGVDVSQSWRVLYQQGDPTTFERREWPTDLNERVHYAPCAARFAREVTIPDVDGPEVHPLALTKAEREALFAISHQVNACEPWEDDGHHLLGFPYNLEGSVIVQCDEEQRRVPAEWRQATPERRLELERDVAARSRLLLQMSGSSATGMDWAGSGYLYWCIDHAALRRRDFSQVWLMMQFL